MLSLFETIHELVSLHQRQRKQWWRLKHSTQQRRSVWAEGFYPQNDADMCGGLRSAVCSNDAAYAIPPGCTKYGPACCSAALYWIRSFTKV
jgi:hypothetical protein